LVTVTVTKPVWVFGYVVRAWTKSCSFLLFRVHFAITVTETGFVADPRSLDW
jgi:hypothetical protein